MLGVIRHLQPADPARCDELTQRLVDGLLPDLTTGPGVATCYVVTLDAGNVTVVALVEGRRDAEAGAIRIDAWIDRHLAPLLTGAHHAELGPAYGGSPPARR